MIDLLGILLVLALAGLLWRLLVLHRREVARLTELARVFRAETRICADCDSVRKAEYDSRGVVLRARLVHPHRFADPVKEFVRVSDNGEPTTLAFTDATFLGGKIRGAEIEGLIKSGEAEIINEHQR